MVSPEIEYTLRAMGLSERTVRQYLNVVKLVEDKYGKPLREVTLDEVFRFLADLTPQSRFAYAVALRSVLKAIGREDYARIKIPRAPHRRYVVIEEEKVKEICMDLAGRDLKLATAIALAYELALRVSELANMKLRDIDMDNWVATVERIKVRLVQRLPIVSDWVRTLLVRYISLHPRHTDYLIYSRKKPYRYSVPSLSWLITRTLREYGVEAKAHDLRHSRATNLLRMGLDIRALQLFLGHTSIAMTERYTHLTEVDLKKMIEELYAKAQK
jgi:integrase/recombinase XerD